MRPPWRHAEAAPRTHRRAARLHGFRASRGDHDRPRRRARRAYRRQRGSLMQLREVVLKNWRSYQAARFTFPVPTPRKKVMLVGAMNGTGKTSLLAALYLGLFGREAMFYVEGVKLSDLEEEKQRSYRLLMERILHRTALAE